SVAAIALQIVGYGVQAWLGNEHGIMHFVDTNASGPKRRQRFRVVVEPQRLLDVTLNTNWTEPSGQPERDPRRTFNLAENLVYDGLTMLEQPCSQSKLVDCLIEAIRNDREALLWSAIDFAGIPPSATLQGDSQSLMDIL
ncbi:MAG: hypothetical protein IT423_01260, partial [Pirellulaceae bacterium]|nr:hypothetical protein [Pirellulaceae bacterium]